MPSVCQRVPPPADARILDGAGRTLMPGLVDAHVHLFSAGQPAWTVYLPDLPGAAEGLGWYDLDPTNNRSGWGSPGEDYVTLALGRDFSDVSPMRGVIHGGARHTLMVAVTVQPVHEPAPPTEGAGEPPAADEPAPPPTPRPPLFPGEPR